MSVKGRNTVIKPPDGCGKLRVVFERRIGFDYASGFLLRCGKDGHIVIKIGYLKLRQTVLTRAEKVSGTAELEVLVGYFKTVGRRGHCPETRARSLAF